jgi:hypothetical protein
MRRLIPILAMTIFTIMATFCCSENASEKEAVSGKENASVKSGAEYVYEALSPWAEVDPIPLMGISPRVDSLAGKKIGLFANFKRAAVPIATEVEKRLKERFPDIETILFHSTLPNVDESETVNKERFTAWAKGVDAVVGVVGD